MLEPIRLPRYLGVPAPPAERRPREGFVVAVQSLANLISARRHQIQCVVLNACFTNTEAEVLLQHVPYLIATTAAINDDAAIAFATGFYQGLAGGDDLGEAFNVGWALVKTQLPDMQEHRKLELRERPRKTTPDSP